jgi:hypothetical protein
MYIYTYIDMNYAGRLKMPMAMLYGTVLVLVSHYLCYEDFAETLPNLFYAALLNPGSGS